MRLSKRGAGLFVFAILLVTAEGCARHGASNGAMATATPAAGATASPAAAPPESGGASPSAAPSVSASAPPNLLAWESGTILRAYPAQLQHPSSTLTDGMTVDASAAGPWVFVFELPGVASLSRISAGLPAKDQGGDASTATFAISTTGANGPFSDVGTLTSAATSDSQAISLNGQNARWIRVTFTRAGNATDLFDTLAAYGTLAPLPSSARIAGTYVQYDNPYDRGSFRSTTDDSDPWYLQVVTIGANGINAQECNGNSLGKAYPGSLEGHTWTWQRQGPNGGPGSFTVNDEGTLVIGSDSESYYVRTTQRPTHCRPSVEGAGKTQVTVLEPQDPYPTALYPMSGDSVRDAPSMRFVHMQAAMLDQATLDASSTLVLHDLCTAADYLNAAQDAAIQQWVQSGHKLLISDSDECGEHTTYPMVPYAFQSNNPGARGASGHRLIQVEDDSLGTSDRSDRAHYFDPQQYVNAYNQIGDANTVTTHDDHWCGHLFGTNVNNVNGLMQMYALYGKGLIIYDGFDEDDGHLAAYQRIRMLELEQPIPAGLPCTQRASLAFLIEPNRTGSFSPGKASTQTFEMQLLANQGWKGHVTITTTGDFHTTVTPSAFDVNGGARRLKVSVAIPASTLAGQYAVIVNGDGGGGYAAQATIQLNAAAPLAQQLKQRRRVRIYGIHFAVDQATITPQSEAVIAQIAQMMKQNPTWRFRIEGHTDSDGGYEHNMVLSRRRAQAVVDDLVRRYHIARARLVPVGYGYSRPVASNATAAGKALNRRVELVRL